MSLFPEKVFTVSKGDYSVGRCRWSYNTISLFPEKVFTVRKVDYSVGRCTVDGVITQYPSFLSRSSQLGRWTIVWVDVDGVITQYPSFLRRYSQLGRWTIVWVDVL